MGLAFFCNTLCLKRMGYIETEDEKKKSFIYFFFFSSAVSFTIINGPMLPSTFVYRYVSNYGRYRSFCSRIILNNSKGFVLTEQKLYESLKKRT